MSEANPDDVVKAASGPLVQIELYQSGLEEAGVPSKVVGLDLTGGLGTMMPDSVELWVHRGDLAKAQEVIAEMEAERGKTAVPEHTEPHLSAGHHGSESRESRPPHGPQKDEPPHPGPAGDHFPGTGRHDYGERGH